MALAYQNPVWPGYFADPFVLRFESEYHAYGTGEGLDRSADGGPHAFTVLHSCDLVTWRRMGGALVPPLDVLGHVFGAPEVTVHAGRYCCFYSGGNWQTKDYGLSYAAADHPLGPWWHAPESEPVVLRQRSPQVLGPGHNSYSVTPDGQTELLVYHAWDADRRMRRMCLDLLIWTGRGPRCLGPTTTRQELA